MSITALVAKSPKCFMRLVPSLQSKLIVGRFTSTGREDCKIRQNPPQSMEDPCGTKRAQIISKKQKKPEFISMWENPECCVDRCPEGFTRYDELWGESDKAKRVYKRTWVECPRMKVITKKVCCMEKKKYPPFKKRIVRKERSKTASNCKPDPSCKPPKNVGICPKISMPDCAPGRDPAKCVIYRPSDDCQKICTPYPSFSECVKNPPKHRRPIECNCLRFVAMCEVMMKARKLQALKKKN